MPWILAKPPSKMQCASCRQSLCDCFLPRHNGLMSAMPASEDSQSAPTSETPASAAAKRGRRGRGRGRRGGGRSPRPAPGAAAEAPVTEAVSEEIPSLGGDVGTTPTTEPVVSSAPPARSPAAAARPSPPRPAPRRDPLASAIGHAQHILKELRDTVAEMEEIIELLEMARTQKADDEQQIATLRRALDQLQRTREQPQHRPERYRPRPVSPPPESGTSQS